MSRSPRSRSTVRRVVATSVGLAALLGAVACGNGSAPPADPAAASASPTADAMAGHDHGGHSGHEGHSGHGEGGSALWAVQTGPLGVVVTDGAGRLIYRSGADSANPPTSTCTDACAETWVPVLAEPGQQPDLEGVSRQLVGEIQRPDGGTQLTLAGWPLYHRADDDGSLTTTGHHGEDGNWFVVTPAGDPVPVP